ncbi:hypothetical protein BDZ97DRAFT_1703478 [Flammula alnicola]|nr:hypothetical protein BDZ97DRAFT_1703478 [Flammula alnicola]
MTSSASSSASASPEAQIAPKLKRKRKEVVKEVADEESEDEEEEEEAGKAGSDGSDSDGSGDDEKVDGPEVPVLSHAERRRQKKAAKLAAKLEETEGSALKKRKLKDGSAKVVDALSATKRQNSVWVGNMTFKTQQDDLRSFFKDVGEITRINLPTKASSGPGVRPENRGFAYIDFATPEAKTAAIALSEQPLLGRKLLIKDGDSFAGRPAAIAGEHIINDPALAHKTHSKTAQKILRAQKQPPGPTLFFGNLGFETTDTSIRELLEAHRPGNKKSKDAPPNADGEEQKPKDIWIRKVRMGTFEDSGLCKGFAFVDFMSVEHATSVLINPKNHHLNGRNLVVEYASPDAVRRGAPKSKAAGDGAPTNKGRRPHRNERLQQRSEAQSHKATETPASEEAPAAESRQKNNREQKDHSSWKVDGTEGTRHKGPKSRPKPGAALALAKRESVAIVPSEGRKITF